jgi:hypothetical protein
MSKKEWKGTDFRRGDFYFARTSREAFGIEAKRGDFLSEREVVQDETNWGDVAVVCLCIVVSIYIMFFGWGD